MTSGNAPQGPTPGDHLDAMQRALALVALAERDDPDGYALALADAVAGPEDAGHVVHGLVQLARFTVRMGLPGLTADERLEVLDGLVADTARAARS